MKLLKRIKFSRLKKKLKDYSPECIIISLDKGNPIMLKISFCNYNDNFFNLYY